MTEAPKRPWTGDGKPLKNPSVLLPEPLRYRSKTQGNGAVGGTMAASTRPTRFFDWRFLLALSAAMVSAVGFTPAAITIALSLQAVGEGQSINFLLILAAFTFFPMMVLIIGMPIYGPAFCGALVVSLPLRWALISLCRVWARTSPRLVFTMSVFAGCAVFCALFATAVFFWEDAQTATSTIFWSNQAFFLLTPFCAACAGWFGYDA